MEERARNENQQAMDNPEAGASLSNTTNRLVLDLAKKKDTSVGTGPPSPILQVDGEIDDDVIKFSFESLYHEDDVMYTLEDIFLESEVDLTL